MTNYIPLHIHSDYSFDSCFQIHQIVKRCKALNLTTCAITDHCNLGGSIKFQQELKKAGIKSILGCEFYVSSSKEERKNKHLVLLCKNLKGWKKLIKIVSAANHPDNFYYKPRLTLEQLKDFVQQSDIIGIAGHLGSIFAEELATKEQLRILQDIFREENFFAEIQLIDTNNSASQQNAQKVRELAQETGTRSVATPDAHYGSQEEAFYQRIILCNKLQTTFEQIDKKVVNEEDIGMGGFFTSDAYYLPSTEEMEQIHTKEELNNTLLIGEMCEDYTITGPPKLPKFQIPPNFSSSNDYLKYLARCGYDKKRSIIEKHIQEFNLSKEQYGKRASEELQILVEAGLADYFLIVKDIIDFAQKDGQIVGAARGSSAGCLISFLLDITKIDPIPYNLLMSRFYNAARKGSLPDIDMDFEVEGRERIIKYIREKYGFDKTSQIITFQRMQGRTALKDVLRVTNSCGFDEMNQITQFIPDEARIADQLQEMREESEDGEASIIDWALDHNKKQLEQWCFKDKEGNLQGPFAKRFEQAIHLEGTKRGTGKHAAGLIISDIPLSEVCPMVYDKKTNEQIIGFDFGDVEKIGLVKMDCLGLSYLSKIHRCLDLISRRENNNV